MMDVFLKYVRIMPLTKQRVITFLDVTADLGSKGFITEDDWKYSAILIMFRVNKYVLGKGGSQ